MAYLLLRHRYKMKVNGKKVLSLMRGTGLVRPVKKKIAGRKKKYMKIEAQRPDELWGMDMTKIWCGEDGR